MASKNEALQVGMVLYPGMTALDFVGPYEVFSRMTNTTVYKLWRNTEPVVSDVGVAILPDTVIGQHPALNMVFVPGGYRVNGALDDDAFMDWLVETGAKAKYVTSICSGALILGAAGLLKGYRAATHWTVRQYLPLFGAILSTDRVVVDRNRFTGGGVTAGIDFALTLCSILRGEKEAKKLQLILEYNPQPPFNAGAPEKVSKEFLAYVQELGKPRMALVNEDIERVIARRKCRA